MQQKEGYKIKENNQELKVNNGVVELSFSKANGTWNGLKNIENGIEYFREMNTENINIILDGTPIKMTEIRYNRALLVNNPKKIGGKRKYLDYCYIDYGDRLEIQIISEENDWSIIEKFIIGLIENKNRVKRLIELKYTGCNEIKLREVILSTPAICVGLLKDSILNAPGYPLKADFKTEWIPEGKLNWFYDGTMIDADAPGFLPGIFSIKDTVKGQGIMIWGYSDKEPSFMDFMRKGEYLIFNQRILTSDWITIGKRIETGYQYIEFIQNEENEFDSIQKWYQEEGITAPQKTDFSNLKIYEAHIGNAVFPEVEYSPFSEVKDLNEKLPEIADMGFNTLLIMPRQPYPSYTVHDYYDISTTFGEKQELRELIEHAHKFGISVILDILLHGCIDKEMIERTVARVGERYNYIFNKWKKQAYDYSPCRQEHPEWFMKDEQGNTAMVYTAAFDHRNPDWHDYIIGVLKYYIKELDIDGFRVDAPTWNMMPNWDRNIPYRGSLSIYGAIQLFRKARQQLSNIKKDLLFYTEPSGPLFRTVFDANYNYDEHWLYGSILHLHKKSKYPGPHPLEKEHSINLNAYELRNWYAHRDMVLPDGSVTVHHIDSHDTFWRYEGHFPREVFGRKASQALFALSALIKGGVMNYAGGENGSEQLYKKILEARDWVLNSGKKYSFSYFGAEADNDMIFTSVWRTCGETALIAINLEDTQIDTVIRVSMSREDNFIAWDYLDNTLYSNAEIEDNRMKLSVSFASYQPRFIIISSI